MSLSTVRRYPRTQIYLPSRCTAFLSHERAVTLEGKTDTVGRGGLRLLLPTLLKPPTPVTVRIAGEGPLQARVVWAGPTLRTDLGTVVPHGLGFVEEISEFSFADLLGALQEKAQVQRSPRLPVRFEVAVMVGETLQRATMLNLSATGAFIMTPAPIAADQELLLHFTLPWSRRPLHLCGRVVWQNSVRSTNGFQPGMGIAFRDLSPEAAKALQDFLRGIPAR